MPRKHRIQEPSGMFHIATRSVFQTFAFHTPDRLDFLWIFSTVVEATRSLLTGAAAHLLDVARCQPSEVRPTRLRAK